MDETEDSFCARENEMVAISPERQNECFFPPQRGTLPTRKQTDSCKVNVEDFESKDSLSQGTLRTNIILLGSWKKNSALNLGWLSKKEASK